MTQSTFSFFRILLDFARICLCEMFHFYMECPKHCLFKAEWIVSFWPGAKVIFDWQALLSRLPYYCHYEPLCMYDQKNNAENTHVDFIGVNKYWSDASHAAACQPFHRASEHGGTQSAEWSLLLLVVCTFTEFTVELFQLHLLSLALQLSTFFNKRCLKMPQ